MGMNNRSGSGTYRTLSERLAAEEFSAGAYTEVEIDSPGMADVAVVVPGATPHVGYRIDSWNNVYLRGAVLIDFDAAKDEFDFSGVYAQPGTVAVLSLPEDARPTTAQVWTVLIAYQVGGITMNLPTLLTVTTSGVVTLSVGGKLQDGETDMEDFLEGSNLVALLSGDFSLN